MASRMIRQLENLVLFPRYLLAAPTRPREDVPGLESIPVESSDGPIDAWFLPALVANGHAAGARRRTVVIFAHGNGELIDDWPYLLEPYRWMGVSVVLPEYRGYGRDTRLFEGFPADLRWHRARLARDELWRVRYIAAAYWVELSGGSRFAQDAAVRIERGIEAYGVSNDGFRRIAAILCAGAPFPPLIAVGSGTAAGWCSWRGMRA